MTYDEIREWAEERLTSKLWTVKEVHDEFVALMCGGGLSKSDAEDEFDALLVRRAWDGAYVLVVPQDDGFGPTIMEMVSVGDEPANATTYPNMLIERDTLGGVWRVSQFPEFEEGNPDELVHIGNVNVNCHGAGFMRMYSEEEENSALANLLTTSDKTWCLF